MEDLEGKSTLRAAQEAILDLFTEATGLPITLLERADDEPGGMRILTPSLSRKNFSGFCDVMMSNDTTQCLCDMDMIRRAEHIYETKQPERICCHAGMFNQLMPVMLDGTVRAVLSYGGVQLSSDDCRKESYQRFHQFSNALQEQTVNVDLVKLRVLRPQLGPRIAGVLSESDFERYRAVLDKILRLLYIVLDGEEQTIRNNDHVKHELQMRLQALLPAIELLQKDAIKHKLPDILRDRVENIFLVAKSMRTVVHTLTKGKFLTNYYFKSEPMWGIVQQAIAVYKAEADGRGIAFQVHLRSGTNQIELSHDHMQMAVDNLIYNAIKYSYTTGEHTPRYVRVYDQSAPTTYTLIIENYGVGILPEEISSGRIYEDGYQGKLTTNEHRTGSGMGLSMAKYVAERHHGWLEITSEPQGQADPGYQSTIPYLTRVALRLPYRQT